MNRLLIISCVCVLFAGSAQAGTNEVTLASDTSSDTRYGLFKGLDHRSSYGQGVYPEPFLVDDSDLETREFRLDWLRTGVGGDHTDIVHPELEWGFGNLTLEVEAPYERGVTGGNITSGMDNVDLGARYPFFQYISKNKLWDTTFGIAVEVGIPTKSALSHNTELVPKLFNDTKIGNFTAQSVFGYSMLFGPAEEGGVQTFEYGFVLGYAIQHDALPIPGVLQLIPVVEISGERQVNKADAGDNSVLGDVGLRANMKTIWGIQPRPGVVFVFPMTSVAREETHWGIMTSLVLEF